MVARFILISVIDRKIQIINRKTTENANNQLKNFYEYRSIRESRQTPRNKINRKNTYSLRFNVRKWRQFAMIDCYNNL